jgi:hypothetical protein
MTPPTATHLRARVCRTSAAAASWRNVAIWILAAPGVAHAAEARGFNLPAQPLPQAVESFAVQAGVSAGLSAAHPCPGRSRAVTAALTPEQALRRLLPRGCAFETPQPRTYRVVGPGPEPASRPELAAVDAAAPVVAEVLITAEKRREPADLLAGQHAHGERAP